MKTSTLAAVAVGILIGGLFFPTGRCVAQGRVDPVVPLAELEIDPAQLDAYKAALREEIAASIRIEPGVLTLYAVSVKGQPNQIRLFEQYASQAAYQAHLQSEHFRNYKTATALMVQSLRLIETNPVMLATK